MYNKIEEGVNLKKLYSFIVLALIMGLSGCGFSFFFTKETAEIDNEHFTYSSYQCREDIDVIEINASCIYTLFEVSATANVYNSENTLIDTISSTHKGEMLKDENFIVSCSVSSNVLNEVYSLEVEFTGFAYVTENVGLIATYRVLFVFNNGDEDLSIKVNKGETVEIDDPICGDLVFDGWYTDKKFTKQFDLTTEIKSNYTLYANYVTSDEAYISYVKEEILAANITVKKTCSNTSFGSYTGVVSTGSGVIFHETTNYYYFLTNNHVTYKTSGYSNVSYVVLDYSLNEYNDVSILNADASYDLAVGRFKKNSKVTLDVVARGTSNPKSNDDIICIGQPNGVTNTVSLGSVLSYGVYPLSGTTVYESNVTFSVIRHTAFSSTGSSGGGLYDSNLNLIGISYAGATLDDEFLYSLAIPIQKVNEFLNSNFWNLSII